MGVDFRGSGLFHGVTDDAQLQITPPCRVQHHEEGLRTGHRFFRVAVLLRSIAIRTGERPSGPQHPNNGSGYDRLRYRPSCNDGTAINVASGSGHSPARNGCSADANQGLLFKSHLAGHDASLARAPYVPVFVRITRLARRCIGASTGVFGAIGLLMGLQWRKPAAMRRRGLRRWTPPVIGAIFLALLGTSGERTDVVAHLAGVAVGMGMGWMVGAVVHRWRPGERGQGAPAGTALLLVVAAWWLALRA